MINGLEEEEKVEARPPLKFGVVTGGKGPPSPNWLKDLPEGTVFLVREKKKAGHAQPITLPQWHLVCNTATAVLLFNNLNQEFFQWFDPYGFCEQWDLHQVIKSGD
jgi:hypothetical protein